MTPETTPEHKPLPQSDPDSTAQQREVNEKRACFPSHARVKLRDGTHIPIARLRVGDLVESKPSQFSPVLLNTHADPHANSTFVVLRTLRGSQIAASPGHYQITSSGRLRLAREFRVHDELRTAFGVDHVVSVRRAIFRGLDNPQTASGKLMVALGSGRSAIQASNYTNAVLPNAAHAAMSPLRALHSILGITFPGLSACARIVATVPLSVALYKGDCNRTGNAVLRNLVFEILIYVRFVLLAFLITIWIDHAASVARECKNTRMFPRALCSSTCPRFLWFTRRFLLTDRH